MSWIFPSRNEAAGYIILHLMSISFSCDLDSATFYHVDATRVHFPDKTGANTHIQGTRSCSIVSCNPGFLGVGSGSVDTSYWQPLVLITVTTTTAKL